MTPPGQLLKVTVCKALALPCFTVGVACGG